MNFKDWVGIGALIAFGLFCLPGCAFTEKYSRDSIRQERINNENTETLSRHMANLNELMRRVRALEEKAEVYETSSNVWCRSAIERIRRLESFKEAHDKRWPNIK